MCVRERENEIRNEVEYFCGNFKRKLKGVKIFYFCFEEKGMKRKKRLVLMSLGFSLLNG